MQLVRTIRRHACERPDALAVIADGREITYRDFDRAISAAIRAFAGRGLTGDGVAAACINDIATAWLVDLALRSLGYDTVAVREGADLGGLTGLDVRLVVTLAGE